MLKLITVMALAFVGAIIYSAVGGAALMAIAVWLLWTMQPGNGLFALLTFAGVGVYLLFESAKR